MSVLAYMMARRYARLSTDIATSAGRSMMLAADAAAQRTLLGVSIDENEFIVNSRVARTQLSSNQSFVMISNTAYFVYVGRVVKTCTPLHVSAYCRSVGSVLQTAELGLFSTSSAPNRSGLSLSKIEATGTITALTGTGFIRNTSAFSTSVAAGTYLWAGMRTAMSVTQPTMIGIAQDFGQGYCQSTASAGALTGTGPWTGAISVASLTAIGPDLRVEID